MKKILMVISYLGLACTLLPSILVLIGVFTLQNHFWLMSIGMVLWFSTSPFWMKSKSLDEVEE
ncbi:hypothetical protein OU798_16965 [Prolixibacteraceae bacterium Z1-6]|uniref:Uncharacterized protein n=1 Tax=Draconibacterium aestuarii TaxID=2998507 RepID=A0A9X3F7L3_9BACT|nr:hypothetical protein [Prolixibacteraceae bacterium Z1-6]